MLDGVVTLKTGWPNERNIGRNDVGSNVGSNVRSNVGSNVAFVWPPLKPRILSETFGKEFYEQTDKLFEEGVIELSDIPYASPPVCPVVPVVIKDKAVRLCCDYRKLNENTIPKCYPIYHDPKI